MIASFLSRRKIKMRKIIVITGAGQGLGYSIVKCHINLQDKIYALDREITGNLKALAADYSSLEAYQCDVSSDDEVRETLKKVKESEKGVDIVYNVAGVSLPGSKVGIAETNFDNCLLMYNINALGAMRVCKNLWPLIGKNSLVVNISSEAGSIGAARRTMMYGYCMSKAAMNMGAKILSNELWKKEARVISIYPGWLRTKMGGEAALQSGKAVDPDESAKNILGIVSGIDNIPQDQMFMSHTGEILPW
jgi:NAD(P)-dependent dehydrogenase (short-subunit alcohol dehydrogenase family)